MNLTAARELNKQEEAQQQLHLWAAILATHDALIAGGLTGLPAVHVERAKAALLRAGDKDAGDYTDTELRTITVTSGARVWSEIDDGDPIFRNEAVVGSNGDLYITTQQHYKRSDLLPGSTAARTLFRLLRTEPEDSTVLDFVWGELVPYGVKRRDPQDGKVYTPIHEQGVTLYEPHYPHLVPSEYKLYEDGGEEPEPGPEPEPEPGDVPDWDDLEEGHTFAVGDHFTHDGTEYEVLRAFNKQENWAPPALLNDYYKEVSA